MMKYQLVIQFPDASMVDYDSLVAFEDRFATMLGDSAEVDGHDFGSGEGNIFILTDDPISTFRTLKALLDEDKALDAVIAAHRRVEEEDYVVIWPEGFSGRFTVQ